MLIQLLPFADEAVIEKIERNLPAYTELSRLIASGLTNREIAEKLFLTEGTVKQYINQIYGKLQITGETRTKRKQLFGLLSSKN